ncbi:Gamma-glutamylputrescine oxidoreductase [Pelagimonas phthalicica]|uniref:Gamma-glutamylputrescine oxidoreductase n=1 Tax=Pelagimonas phthalicica TaxID=1037362 RepID=A0A238JEI2_9RHOB|nr:FAD-binding oxidoreductase [Pelagimonas phthalicica]TDS91989.1 glycine/D-amino acid oxidase-like deaminating enzyme [Pelagimonas phthalicica]SMX29039.1 Gamma-glutamylputrescine oxidoreductase [Pelagimonas phthalicica]
MTRKVTQLPALIGPAAWAEILPQPATYPALPGPATADVVIIGAGFAGLSAARRLKQLAPDASVTVLDALRIAQGSAGRNSGFMIDLPHDLASSDYAGPGNDRTLIDLNRQAIDFGRAAVEEFSISPDYFDPSGKVNGTATEAAHQHNLTYGAHLTHLGEDSEMLDAQQMREMTGSSHYLSGLYTPGTVTLQPAGYIRGLAAGLAAQGVQIHECSPVTHFAKQSSAWQITTPEGKISAGKVILTVNGHLQSFGFAKGRLMQLFLFAMMTPDLDAESLRKLGGQPRWGITPSDPMGTTMRRIDSRQGGNRIITRTCAVLKPGMRASQTQMQRAAGVMRRKFDQRFPQLAGIAMEYQWSGHLCLSRNGVSVTSELEPGLFSACAQNGLGTARGTLTGIAAAELAMGANSEISRFFSTEAQPTRLPPQPFQEIGANLVLRYREWLARAD